MWVRDQDRDEVVPAPRVLLEVANNQIAGEMRWVDLSWHCILRRLDFSFLGTRSPTPRRLLPTRSRVAALAKFSSNAMSDSAAMFHAFDDGQHAHAPAHLRTLSFFKYVLSFSSVLVQYVLRADGPSSHVVLFIFVGTACRCKNLHNFCLPEGSNPI